MNRCQFPDAMSIGSLSVVGCLLVTGRELSFVMDQLKPSSFCGRVKKRSLEG